MPNPKKTIEEMFEEINSKLSNPETGLPGINDKLDALTADMYHVQKLASGTYELLTHYTEKHGEQLAQLPKKVKITSRYD